MSTLDTHYTAAHEADAEATRYTTWETSGAFTPAAADDRFSMILPPPNITGSLHMGHAYEHTISDAIIRHQRMAGRETLWLPGTDHAGIATQALMERQLAAEGTSRHQLGRDAFLTRTRAWREQTGETITTQMRRLGTSPDWSRATYTLDEGPSLATHTAFTRLYEQGLIYRAARETSWCTRCTTTLADIETEDTDAGLACTRCGSAIVIRTTPQWFLKTDALAARAREALTSGELAIESPAMAQAYLRWIDDMHDWCLSRQLWWGHRIPIWYGPDGQTHSFGPGETIPDGWRQDEDTLDTWFSSALWPLSTLGWPRETADLGRFYPNDLMITGTDLLFFWAIRMTMLCTHLAGQAPFRRLYLHGMIRDEHGKKMSKSFGNTIDPLEFIDEFGPDALRLAMCRKARPGADIPFGRSDMLGAQGLAKKLWSIARLAQGYNITSPAAADANGRATPPPASTHPLDRWLASRLEQTRAAITDAFADLDLAAATKAFATFLESDLSDLYLEARKPALREDPAARATFAAALSGLLLLAHPIIPFLTERLSEALGGPTGPLDAQPWPTPRPDLLDEAAHADAEQLRALLYATRSHRAAHTIPTGTRLPAAITGLACAAELVCLGRLDETDGLAEGDARATTLRSGPATLTLGAAAGPPPGQLRRQLERETATAASLRARLDDPSFAERAPAPIRERTASDLERTLAEMARLAALL